MTNNRIECARHVVKQMHLWSRIFFLDNGKQRLQILFFNRTGFSFHFKSCRIDIKDEPSRQFIFPSMILDETLGGKEYIF